MKANFDEKYYNEAYFHTADKSYHEGGAEKKWGYKAGGWDGWYLILFSLRNIINFKTVLDVGCGCGSFVHECVKQSYNAHGCDFSSFAVSHPHGLAKGRLSQMDARELKYKDNSYDLVTCLDLMEHIYDEDVDKVLQEIRRVSKKFIVFNICTNDQLEIVFKPGQDVPEEYEGVAVSGHVNIRTRDYWLKKLEANGIRHLGEKTNQFYDKIKGAIPNWLLHYLFICEKA
jgi:SAM-dependent methyltransferase